MLPKSAKQKGKRLEKLVARELKKIFGFVYSRADSGSGKHHKEDITLPDDVPLSIECKNQAELQINSWFKKIELSCPSNKYPVLIYKQNYQREPKVVMRISDFINLLTGKEYKHVFNFLITFGFKDFLTVCKHWKFWYGRQRKING